jgi:hypothetical protein
MNNIEGSESATSQINYGDTMRSHFGNSWLILFVLLGLVAVPAHAAKDFSTPVEYAPIYVDDIEPEIVSLERLAKGLSVVYYLQFFERHLDEIPRNGSSTFIKKSGSPVFELNHQFGQEELFDSGTNRGVAMRMQGYLVVKETGTFEFQALSNDGVIVRLGGKTVISDPEQHSDRLSNVGHVTIDKAGHYPLLVEYFQRKGTAALKLFWKTPGSDKFVPIPAPAYVHLP